jgi:hypothetical protein
MKLIMTLLVRDEEDIVAANIDFHLAHGVDFIIAMDNLSVDRTPQLLRKYEERGLLHYILQTEDDFAQHRWVTDMARLAFSQFGADWVIHTDADEFWYPEQSDLKQILSAIPPSYDAAAVERSNFVPRPFQNHEFFADAMTVRDRKSVNALGQSLPGKLCHRAFSDIEIEQGNHAVRRRGREIATASPPIIIFHFPVRSYRQFANKIALGGAAYARNSTLPSDVGGTWRYLYDIWQKGQLEAYYRDMILDDQEIENELINGRLIRDARLKHFFSIDNQDRHTVHAIGSGNIPGKF